MTSMWNRLLLRRQARRSTQLCRDGSMYPADENSDHGDKNTEMTATITDTAPSPDIFDLAASGKTRDLEALCHVGSECLTDQDARGRTLLHHAAIGGQLSTLQMLLLKGADVDAVDDDGNTALHFAAVHNRPSVVDCLCKHGTDTSLLNNNSMAAIHIATENDHSDVLKILLSQKNVSPDLRGSHGSTALHYAACKDHDECAKILLKHGAHMCAPSDIGMRPIHVAAQHASSKTLELFITEAEKMGYTRQMVLSWVTTENGTPLHAAINARDLKAVAVCLKAGSVIDAKQEDGGTAVHLAASQGSPEILRALLEQNPDKKALLMNLRDKHGAAPLHKAALLNKPDAAKYLLEQGADIEAKCNHRYTSLIVSAMKHSWNATNVLVQFGADCREKDEDDRNILHLIILGGARLEDFKFSESSESMRLLLDERDRYGCTPLHYASREGCLNTLNSLIDNGALINIKSNDRQSALHFAAGHGRYNTCRRLLESHNGHTLVNETDEDGQTPVHAAAANGHTKVVQLLMHNGGTCGRDVAGNTPAHLAAQTGYTKTLEALLSVAAPTLNSINREQDTPLHLAARGGHANVVTLLLTMEAEITRNQDNVHFLDVAIQGHQKDVCIAVASHPRWKEAMSTCSSLYGCPMVGMIKYQPEVCQLILDRCRTQSSCDPKDKDFHYEYDFKFLQVKYDTIKNIREAGMEYQPMFALNTMVTFNRVDCLYHPVCIEYLRMKWKAFGLWFHLVNLGFYLTFLAALTGFVVRYADHAMNNVDKLLSTSAMHSSTDGSTSVGDLITPGSMPAMEAAPNRTAVFDCSTPTFPGEGLLEIIVLLFCAVNIVKEVAQMFQQKLKYFMDLNNLLEWVLYLTCAWFIAPYTFCLALKPHWECGAMAIFLAWFNLLLFLQRFDFYGIYVVMFLSILKTLVKVLSVFSILIIGFGLSFYIILSPEEYGDEYSTPGLSLMTTLVMMLGNIAYSDNWVLSSARGSSVLQNELKYLMLAIFIFLMPILLINLMIGLAVGDIEAVRKDARLKRLAMQVEFITSLEGKLPLRLLKCVDKPTAKIYPNRGRYLLAKIWSTLSAVGGAGDLGDQQGGLESQAYLYQQLHKQKYRMKAISADLQKQSELLRLIVQKMEIRSEADDYDEGGNSNQDKAAQMADGKEQSLGWSSPALRQTVLMQTLVAHGFKKFAKK